MTGPRPILGAVGKDLTRAGIRKLARFWQDVPVHVTHATSPAKLIRARDRGGFPNPSLAVQSDSYHLPDDTGYGDVYLVAPRTMLADQAIDIYNGDAYTDRAPSAVVTSELYDKIRNDVRQEAMGLVSEGYLDARQAEDFIGATTEQVRQRLIDPTGDTWMWTGPDHLQMYGDEMASTLRSKYERHKATASDVSSGMKRGRLQERGFHFGGEFGPTRAGMARRIRTPGGVHFAAEMAARGPRTGISGVQRRVFDDVGDALSDMVDKVSAKVRSDKKRGLLNRGIPPAGYVGLDDLVGTMASGRDVSLHGYRPSNEELAGSLLSELYGGLSRGSPDWSRVRDIILQNITPVQDALRAVRSAPTPYLEAKANRPMALSEFPAVIAPDFRRDEVANIMPPGTVISPWSETPKYKGQPGSAQDALDWLRANSGNLPKMGLLAAPLLGWAAAQGGDT